MDRFTPNRPSIPRLTTLLASLAFSLTLAEPPDAAQVYTYKDADGVYHFSSTPVPGARPFDLETPSERRAAARPKPRRRPAVAASMVALRTAPAAAIPALALHSRYDGLILEYAELYGVEPELVKAVIHVESNFDRHAVSHRGARGLMQLMPNTAGLYGARNLHDPRENIHAGVRHLRELIDRYGNLRLAVAAYNAGAGAVDRYRGLPPYRETRRYVEKVLRFRDDYLRRRETATAAASGEGV